MDSFRSSLAAAQPPLPRRGARHTFRVMTTPHPYAGLSAALLTQHGKEHQLAPALGSLGIQVMRVGHIDTDTLGTFTREVARAGSQLEAARRKAWLAAEGAGTRLGLGSEGAFTTDPHTGLIPWNIEMIALIDRERGIEIVGVAESEATNVGQRWITSRDALHRFAAKHGFPSHGLVLAERPLDGDTRGMAMVKGITDAEQLDAVATPWLAQGGVWVETDLRAHLNPTRRKVISAAAADLTHRLASLCPACGSPGWARVRAIPGRVCASCGSPTSLPRAWRWGCVACAHTLEEPIDELADPSRCDWCNP